MAKKIYKKIIEEPKEKGNVIHVIEESDFKEIIRENLRAQEAALNSMKLISKSLFGEDLNLY